MTALPAAPQTAPKLELLLLLALATLWGASYTLIKIGVATILPVTFIAARTVIAGGILFVILRLRGLRLAKDFATWRRFLFQACLNSVIPFTLIAWAEQTVDAGLATILNSTTPIFAFMLTAMITRHEALSARKLFGVVAGITGIVLIIGFEVFHGVGENIMAQLAIVAATVCYAGAAIFGRGFKGLDPMMPAAGSAKSTGAQSASAVSMLPGGKILLGGQCRGSSVATVGICVMRLNADGSVDTSFANAGRSIASSSLLGENLNAMLVRPDGGIVIATECNVALVGTAWDTCVSRLTANGAWDGSFGSGGTQQIHLSSNNRKPRLAQQADGKLIVASVCSSTQLCAVRLNLDGSFDTSYDFPGAIPFPPPADLGEYGVKPLQQADGFTVFIGTGAAAQTLSLTVDFFNLRALATGRLDESYTGGGYKTMGTASDRANDAALQPDGKVVIAGTCENGASFLMCSARLMGGPDGGDGDGGALLQPYGAAHGRGGARRPERVGADGDHEAGPFRTGEGQIRDAPRPDGPSRPRLGR